VFLHPGHAFGGVAFLTPADPLGDVDVFIAKLDELLAGDAVSFALLASVDAGGSIGVP
jgi:hypothetical protein